MGWKPAPRWDKYNHRYHVTVRGKRYILGRDYAKALRRLAELLDGQDRTNSINVMIGDWLKNHSSNWHDNLAKKFHLFLTAEKIESVASDLLERYAAHLRNAGLKPQTQRHYVNAATSILILAKRHGRIAHVPFKPKLPPIRRRPKDLDEASLRKLLTALQRPGLERASRLIRFILATGCRPGEGRLLRWEEVRLEQRVCLLDRHKNEHHGQNRTIYLSDHAVAILHEASKGSDRKGHVFFSSRGQPYQPVVKDHFPTRDCMRGCGVRRRVW